jgi:hypothetical protein
MPLVETQLLQVQVTSLGPEWVLLRCGGPTSWSPPFVEHRTAIPELQESE